MNAAATSNDIFDAIFAADAAAGLACDDHAAAAERTRLCLRALWRTRGRRGSARAERRLGAAKAAAQAAEARMNDALRAVHALRTAAGCYDLD